MFSGAPTFMKAAIRATQPGHTGGRAVPAAGPVATELGLLSVLSDEPAATTSDVSEAAGEPPSDPPTPLAAAVILR